MTDVMVSIRLPSSLVAELRNMVSAQHYLDISEAIRGILRHKWETSADPYTYELQQLRRSITDEMKKQVAKQSERRLTEELKKMRERIRDGL